MRSFTSWAKGKTSPASRWRRSPSGPASRGARSTPITRTYRISFEQVEAALLADIGELTARIGAATLEDLYRNIDDLAPAPGSVELLSYLRDHHALIGSLLGPGGDPAFIKKLIDLARGVIANRMQTGIFPGALARFSTTT